MELCWLRPDEKDANCIRMARDRSGLRNRTARATPGWYADMIQASDNGGFGGIANVDCIKYASGQVPRSFQGCHELSVSKHSDSNLCHGILLWTKVVCRPQYITQLSQSTVEA